MLKIVKHLWAVRAPTRTRLGSSQRSSRPVMWSETVGLRTIKTGLRSKSGLGLGLAGFMLCCEIQSCHACLISTSGVVW